VLPTVVCIVEATHGKSYAIEIWKFPLADNTVGRKISYISEDFCDQLTNGSKTSHFALQVVEATYAHLITYVMCWKII
jgi:hypothetical protein